MAPKLYLSLIVVICNDLRPQIKGSEIDEIIRKYENKYSEKYLEKMSYPEAKEFLTKEFFDMKSTQRNPISFLNEYCQKNSIPPPTYTYEGVIGGSSPKFSCSIVVLTSPRISYKSQYLSSKQEAKSECAEEAMNILLK